MTGRAPPVVPDLAGLLPAQSTLVTPNRRLAAFVRRAFDADQVAAGLATWPSPDILPWGAWVARLHADLTRYEPGARLLTAAEEQAVWQQAIADSPYANALLDTVATARVAIAAHQLSVAWRLQPAQWVSGRSGDCEAWLSWSDTVERRCRTRGWMSAAQLADQVALLLPDQPQRAPPHLILLGFDQLTPQERDLLEVLRRAGTAIDERQPEGVSATVERREYLSADDELEAVAHRARLLLDADPSLRIGVVVPDLAERRADVMRVFDDHLEPARAIGAGATAARPFNVSLGVPLADYPLVKTSLMALRLVRGESPLTEIGALLRSPFLGDADAESTARALLDAALRERRQLTVKLATLKREAAGAGRQSCPALLARLRAWEPLAAEARSLRQRPSAWSSTFVALLSALGWPGERAPDSEEFQTWQKWREVVSGLSVLDDVLGNLGLGEALSWLSRLCAETLFQAESDLVPVQVLGLLEAAGLTFDRLFVTGMHDEAWPPPARPNPFLPVALQRRHGVPHASADWERGFAERTTTLLRSGATHVVFSHPTRDGDRERRASPLLAGMPLAAPDSQAAVPVRNAYWHRILDGASLDKLRDSWAPALPRPHHSSGGANVFRDQSACPFRAFARHRLGARTLAEAGVGIDAASRGLLLHAALAALWGEIGSSEHLLALAPPEVEAAIARAIEAAWVGFLKQPGHDDLSGALVAVERHRMARLLAAMLDLDRARPPFTVRDLEVQRRLELHGLEVDGRIDRIDLLPEDVLFVVDYKTSGDGAGVWAGDRPEQPQLPLYAVLEDGDVGAIAFARLRADGVAYEGVGHSIAAFDGVDAIAKSKRFADEGDWRVLLDRWRARLGSLADEFLDGRADVAPTNGPLTCRYCDLGSLCRIAEIGNPARGLPDADADVDD